MKFTTKSRLALLAAVASAVLIQPAMALDAQAFVDQLVKTYSSTGLIIQPGPASLDGTTITVKGAKVGFPDGEMSSIDSDLTFNGVEEQDGGGYYVESLTMPDVEYDITGETPGHVSLKAIEVDDLRVPGGDKPSFVSMLQLYGSAGAGPLVVTRKGAQVLSIDSISTTNTFNPEEGGDGLIDVSSTFDLEGFKADLTTVGEEDPSSAETIKALGMEKVSGSISESQSWTVADGHLSIDDLSVDLDDKGSLQLMADISGLTPAVMEMISASQASAADKAKTPEQLEQENMALGMQLLSAISITSASVRYDDASLANALMGYFAKQQGLETAQFVQGLKSMVPAMLAGVGIPALDAIVVPPVTAFLDDPKSLEVAVAPASPTTLITLMGAAANPAGLISMLGLTVTANEADAND